MISQIETQTLDEGKEQVFGIGNENLEMILHELLKNGFEQVQEGLVAETNFSASSSGQELLLKATEKIPQARFVFSQDLPADPNSLPPIYKTDTNNLNGGGILELRNAEKDSMQIAGSIPVDDIAALIADGQSLNDLKLGEAEDKQQLIPTTTRYFLKKEFVKGKDRVIIEIGSRTFAYPYLDEPVLNGSISDVYNDIQVRVQNAEPQANQKLTSILEAIPSKYPKKFKLAQRRKNALKKAGILKEYYSDREFEGKMIVDYQESNLEEVIGQLFDLFNRNKVDGFSIFRYYRDIDERAGDKALRSVFGYEDDGGKIHEIVTLINLSPEERKVQGIAYVLKWKSDPLSDTNAALERMENIQKFHGEPDIEAILAKAKIASGHEPKMVGQFRKQKLNFIIEDTKKNAYAFSIDETRPTTETVMRQIEIEYIYSFGQNKMPTQEDINESIRSCQQKISKSELGITMGIRQTTQRKIDFVRASQATS